MISEHVDHERRQFSFPIAMTVRLDDVCYLSPEEFFAT